MSTKCDFKKTILYEAHFTPEQEAYAELCAKARMIAWNYVLKELDRYYKKVDAGLIDPYDVSQYFDFNALSKRMTKWRKRETTMFQVPRHVMGMALIDIRNTHWAHLLNPNSRGRPNSKNLNDPKTKKTFQLFKVNTGKSIIKQINGRFGKIRLSNVFKWIKINLEKEWQNPGILTLTVRKYEDGKWRIIIVWETEDGKRHKGDGSDIAIDVGSDHAISLSNGEFYDVPESVERLDGKRRAFQHKLSLKQKGSGRYKKTDRRKRFFEIKKSRMAKGWIDRIVHAISSRYDTVFVEDINLTELAEGDWNNKDAKSEKKSKSKRTVNRKMAQSNLGLFRRKLNEKTNVIKVPSPYTSQDCPSCGHREKENRNKAKFKCVACGRTAHADTNAAKNILKRGLISLGRTSGHDTASVKERIHPSSNGLALEQRLAEALQGGKLSLSSSSYENPEEILRSLTESRQDE